MGQTYRVHAGVAQHAFGDAVARTHATLVVARNGDDGTLGTADPVGGHAPVPASQSRSPAVGSDAQGGITAFAGSAIGGNPPQPPQPQI